MIPVQQSSQASDVVSLDLDKQPQPQPQPHSTNETSNDDLYGYGDAEPDVASQYDYESHGRSLGSGSFHGTNQGTNQSDAADPGTPKMTPVRTKSTSPTALFKGPVSQRRMSATATCKSPRRSSLKTSSSYGEDGKEHPNRTLRRASIQCGREFEVQLPGQETPVIRRSSIQFHEQVRILAVENIRDMIPDSEMLWFQNDEYKQMRRKSTELVRRAEKEEATAALRRVRGTLANKAPPAQSLKHLFKFGHTKNHHHCPEKEENAAGDLANSSCTPGGPKKMKYCLRGLEKIMRQNQIRCKWNRLNAWNSVLDEQDYQRDMGHFDGEGLASNYQLQTIASKLEATKRGQEDAKEIESYLADTRRYCRRMSM